jgi:hypothetical protein
VTCQFRISDVSVPYQYRPFSAPDVCECSCLKYTWRLFSAGHSTDGTDTELISVSRTSYGTSEDNRLKTVRPSSLSDARKCLTLLYLWLQIIFITVRCVAISLSNFVSVAGNRSNTTVKKHAHFCLKLNAPAAEFPPWRGEFVKFVRTCVELTTCPVTF